MKFLRFGIVLAAVGLVLLVAGCAGSGAANTAPAPAATMGTNGPPPAAIPAVGDRLAVGNRVTIVFSGVPTPPEPHTEQIRSDGFIQPPMLPLVKAAGLSIAELQQELRKLYVPGYFKDVTITVKSDERYIFVGGEVKMPGQKPYLSDMTVIKAIQSAGDFTEYADKTNVWINRADGRQEKVDVKAILRDPRKDVVVFPGDSIHVPRTIF